MHTILLWPLLLQSPPGLWLDDWETARTLGRLQGKPIFAIVH